MKHTIYRDEQGIELSIHESAGNGHVIHLTDNQCDCPFDTMAYSLSLEDVNGIIKDLQRLKRQLLNDSEA